MALFNGGRSAQAAGIASTARTPSAERTRICRRAWALSEVQKPRDSPMEQFKSWTLRKCDFSIADQRLTVHVREFYRTLLGQTPNSFSLTRKPNSGSDPSATRRGASGCCGRRGGSRPCRCASAASPRRRATSTALRWMCAVLPRAARRRPPPASRSRAVGYTGSRARLGQCWCRTCGASLRYAWEASTAREGKDAQSFTARQQNRDVLPSETRPVAGARRFWGQSGLQRLDFPGAGAVTGMTSVTLLLR